LSSLRVRRSGGLSGSVTAPPSKSHTHRAIVIASLADGLSSIANPLLSDDCLSTIGAARALGAKVEMGERLLVGGTSGEPSAPSEMLDVGNSGTTMRLASGAASLCTGPVIITGDASVRARPMGPLLRSLNDLGADAISLEGNGNPPVRILGRLKGGQTILNGVSSQFLSALLIACPLAENDTIITVENLHSSPYVDVTLRHLSEAGAVVERDGGTFHVPGGQGLDARDFCIPGDYSSAAFVLGASYVTGSKVEVAGLDPDDAQGDKAILEFIGELKMGDVRAFDLRDTPDLLPIMAVLGCYSEGETVLENVAHARLKETDRIAVMCSELRKLGADVREREDGLVVRRSNLSGCDVDGHGDHRVVMALAVAGLGAEGETVVSGAETIPISYPGFVSDLKSLGADVDTVAE